MILWSPFSNKTLVFHLWPSCSGPFSNSYCCFPNSFPRGICPSGPTDHLVPRKQYPHPTPWLICLMASIPLILTIISGIVSVSRKFNLFILLRCKVFMPALEHQVCTRCVIYPLGKPFMTLQLTSKHLVLAKTWYPDTYHISTNHSAAWDSTHTSDYQFSTVLNM